MADENINKEEPLSETRFPLHVACKYIGEEAFNKAILEFVCSGDYSSPTTVRLLRTSNAFHEFIKSQQSE